MISAVISNILVEGITLELVVLYVWRVYDKSVSLLKVPINIPIVLIFHCSFAVFVKVFFFFLSRAEN